MLELDESTAKDGVIVDKGACSISSSVVLSRVGMDAEVFRRRLVEGEVFVLETVPLVGDADVTPRER